MNGSNGMNGSMSTNGATAKGDAMGTVPAATPKFTDSPEQAAVIQAPSYEDVVVVAGAGSGKTYPMTRRIITLIDQGISPEKILGLTFTRKAASELLSRVSAAVTRNQAGRGTRVAFLKPEVSTYDAFFQTIVRQYGLLVGFGSGNIFRRLNREAPIGAIRRSIRDTMSARSHGMRASGLEDYFADLMREAHALDTDQGLEAVHGAEPLRLYTSSYSGCYFFAWDSSLPFSAVLCALNIEGNLNRFAAVSSWLERNARIGALPTENTVTRAEAAQIDFALLENPALIALKPDDRFGAILDPNREDGIQAASRLADIAADFRREVAESTKDNVLEGDSGADGGSEWVYRQTCEACACHTVSTLTSGATSATAKSQSASLLLECP